MKPMGKQYQYRSNFALSVILAIVLPVFLAIPAQAQKSHDAKMQVSETDLTIPIKISGGEGKSWSLFYGNITYTRTGWGADADKVNFANTEGARAWFSHGSWLRLIDTANGMVLGRWHFPGIIQSLSPKGKNVEVVYADYDGNFGRISHTFLFDPVTEEHPFYASGYLLTLRVAENETKLSKTPIVRTFDATKEIHPDAATLDLYREQAKRDPFSPWLQIYLGTALKNQGDVNGKKMLEQALEVKGADFTELFNICAFLNSHGEPELAQMAFEKGYADYFRKGNDPRLLSALIGRLVLYRSTAYKFNDWNNLQQKVTIRENVFRLMPYGELSDLAWEMQSRVYATQGKSEEAQFWHQRALDASRYGGHTFQQMSRIADHGILISLSSQMAAIILFLIFLFKYRAQRKLDLAAGRTPKGLFRIFAFLRMHYWSVRERITVMLILAIGWLALGVAVTHLSGIMRIASTPVEVVLGHYQSPLAIKFFKETGVSTPERDACLALAYQQNGDLGEAERLYRSVPQFAMAWNNLGVILKQQNKEGDASSAFKKALQLDPNLHEAELNLHDKSTDTWTQFHQQYLPGKPMLAVPDKRMAAYSMTEFSGWNRLRILLGPLANVHIMQTIANLAHGVNVSGELPRLFILIVILQMLFASTVLFIIPHFEVTQAPGAGFHMAQLFIPGIATSDPWIGTIVFSIWSYVLTSLLLLKTFGSPYMITLLALPSFRGFELIGLNDAMMESAGLVSHHAGDWNTLMNPSWEMVYLLPAVLFVLNVIYVWRKRKVGNV